MLWLVLAKQVKGDLIGICSTNAELSRSMARRLKAILLQHGVIFDERETVLTFPHARIQWFPSDPTAIGGYSPIFCCLDEWGHEDFSSNVWSAIDSYSIRSKESMIYAISTPGSIDTAGFQVWSQKESIYERITINWRDCVDKMFTMEQLNKLRSGSSSFSQEYENRFGVVVSGSTFSTSSIDAAITNKPTEPVYGASRYMGWDVGFSAASAATIITLVDGYAVVLHSQQYEQKDQHDFYNMVETCASLILEYDIDKCWIDSSAPSLIKAVAERLGLEEPSAVITRNKQNKLPWDTSLRVIPFAFSKYGRDSLYNAKLMLEQNDIKIHSDFTELIEYLRTCKDQEGLVLKKQIQYHHTGISFLMALSGVELNG